MNTQKENRIFYYDNLRFFLIALVVIGHFVDETSPLPDTFKSIFLWIYSFHMPLFLFLNGMFHKNEKIMPKVTRFVMIGFVLKIVTFLERLAIGKSVTLSYFRMNEIPWYMFVLAGFTVLTYLLRKMDKRGILIFAIILGLFSGYDSSLGDMFAASRFIVYYPFFVLGNMITPDKPLKIFEKKWVRIIGVLVLVAWAAICVFKLDSVYILRSLFTGRNSFGDKFGTWAFLYRGLSYVITVIIGLAVMSIIPKAKLPVVTRLGGRTLQIYFWHYIVLYILLYLQIGQTLCTDAIGKLIWLLLAVVCTLVLGLKPFEFPTNQIVNLSRYAKEQTEKEKHENN